MPVLGTKSLAATNTCHHDLQRVIHRAIQFVDFSVIYGHRQMAEQNKAFELGHSTKKFPDSKHNAVPSDAFDALPYPSGWPREDDTEQQKLHRLAQFYYMAGVIMYAAELEGVKLRWGGDWDMDKDFLDQTFDDLAHFERVT